MLNHQSPQQRSQGKWDAFKWATAILGLCSIFAFGYLTFSRIQPIACGADCSSTSSFQTNLDTDWPIDIKIGLAFLALGIGLIFVFAVSVYLLYRQSSPKAQTKQSENYIRGTIRTALEDINARTYSTRVKEPGPHISIGGVIVPQNIEHLHWLVCGSPRSGKTTFIQAALIAIAQREHNQVAIYDCNEDYLRKFYNDGRNDIILGISGKINAAWSVWHESDNEKRFGKFAEFLIPKVDEPGVEYFKGNQRIILRELLKKVNSWHALRAIITGDFKLAIGILKDTPAFKILCMDKGEEFFGALNSITDCLDYFPDPDPSQAIYPFSFSAWATSQDSSWVFLVIPDEDSTQASTLLATYFDQVAQAIYKRKVDHTGLQRLWLICDELKSAAYQPQLEDYLSKAPKYGGVAVLGFQNINQIYDVYGIFKTKAIFANCQIKILLRTTDGETCEFLSNAVGKVEYYEPTLSVTYNQGQVTKTKSYKCKEAHAFIPSEISNLPVLNGIVTMPTYPCTQVELSAIAHNLPDVELPTPKPESEIKSQGRPTLKVVSSSREPAKEENNTKEQLEDKEFGIEL